MAFLSGCHYDDDDDHDDIDIADQPTQPLPKSLAALAIASAQRQVLELQQREAAADASPLTAFGQQKTITGLGRRAVCPLCCMDLEEKIRNFLNTDGALLLICDYHIGQIKRGKNDEEIDLFADILHVAYQRYSWPPGEDD